MAESFDWSKRFDFTPKEDDGPKVIVTPRYLMDKCCWDEYCEMSGTSVWAVNEGMPSDTPITLTMSQVRELGIRLD